eukprot:12693891-Ditylum_brightwellii.AAC.1
MSMDNYYGGAKVLVKSIENDVLAHCTYQQNRKPSCPFVRMTAKGSWLYKQGSYKIAVNRQYEIVAYGWLDGNPVHLMSTADGTGLTFVKQQVQSSKQHINAPFEAHSINNTSSEQFEATQKQDRYVDDEHEMRLKEVDNALSLSLSSDCMVHGNRDMPVEIADFIISKSSASYLPLNSAEMTSTNDPVMSESECSSLHQINSICSSALNIVELLYQICSPTSVVLEYYLTMSSTNNLSNPYSLENKQVCVCDMTFTNYRQCVVCNFEGKKRDGHRYNQ